ncbi:SNF2-related protein [Romboutsia sp.]|uniref:DEAD/DEAH box helicase n=1 Tax=Romboutsia sp. TaxID=1965302 RepID=UPI003F410CAA
MNLVIIEEILKDKTDKNRFTRGFASYKRDSVYNNYAKVDGEVATFYGSVRGEGYGQNNTSMITINTNTRVITSMSCDCSDCVSMSNKPQICSHIVAIVLKGLESLKTQTPPNKESKVISSKISIEITNVCDESIGIDFNISGIDKSEYKNIFNSFKENKKMYRLKNGDYLDLRENNIFKALEFLEILGINKNIENIKVPKIKALFIEQILEDNDYSFIKGKNYISELTEKHHQLSQINYEVPANLNATLRDYQISGYKFLRTLSEYSFGGILADEMGLGKTIQIITFLLSQQNKKSIVITPTALIYNWKNEFEKFAPTLKIGLAYNGIEQRNTIINEINNYDVILTTYGTLKNDLEKYQGITFDYCIIDEAQQIKNPKSISSKTVKDINAKVRFALTGTPVENNLTELWSIFDFIMPGYLFNESKFQQVFIKDSNNLTNLKKLIKPFMLRRTKKEVIKELPDKIEQKFFVELGKDHRKVYNGFVKVIKNKIKESNQDKITVFSYLTKLRQMCLIPELMVKNYNGKNSKLNITLKLIEESNDNKILIFSQFTGVLKTIGKELENNNIPYFYLDGKTPASERVKLVDEFNNTNDAKVFLISLKAGGTGLNLTSASMVIHFDPWWNPAVEDQASDRAHRLGQKNVVNVIKLIAKDTVEEKVLGLQEVKKELIEDIINDNLGNSSILKNLSSDELIDLFIQ